MKWDAVVKHRRNEAFVVKHIDASKKDCH